jgi:hypothetical protein
MSSLAGRSYSARAAASSPNGRRVCSPSAPRATPRPPGWHTQPSRSQDPPTAPAFERWVAARFERGLAELQWAEIARALVALSSDYVHRRERLPRALAGRGKRAAFALYYAPRHLVIVREVLRALTDAAARQPRTILDLGCGTGGAGAAWSAVLTNAVPVLGVDAQAWAVDEARDTYRTLGLRARTVRTTIERLRWPAGPLGIVAAFTINEMSAAARGRLLPVLVERARGGDAVLVVEPLATRVSPWWPAWERTFAARGGRADLWRFDVMLPEPVEALGRSAGLDPRDLGCRSLWLPPRSPQDAGADGHVGADSDAVADRTARAERSLNPGRARRRATARTTRRR